LASSILKSVFPTPVGPSNTINVPILILDLMILDFKLKK